MREAWMHSRVYFYASLTLINLIALCLPPWGWLTLLNALAALYCADLVWGDLKTRGWTIRLRPIPEVCDECGARPWWSWLKPSFTTFETSPIQTIWAWSLWLGPIHAFKVHPEEGLALRFALYRKRDPRNHAFVPCANNDGRDGHNFTCEELCIHCGRPRKAHE